MKVKVLFIAAISILTLISCYEKPEISVDINEKILIPLPRNVEASPTSFVIVSTTKVYAGTTRETQTVARSFVSHFKQMSGLELELVQNIDLNAKDAIHFNIILDRTLADEPEGYILKSKKDQISIEATSSQGLFRGLQTLYQLIPREAIYNEESEFNLWVIAGCTIVDYPEYEYRGAMLDVARHFFTVTDVKRYIDLIALYKINKLHLHLTDDQGWRIEIKSWPKLTEIGGSTEVGGGEGGFYTQEQYKEIVDYAAQRHIEVIPEIDMPGHTNAVLASYPELNCNNRATALYTGMRVGFSSLCIDKEITYQFVDDVIKEVAAITPGEYIHLGGDESHATSKEDYNLFLKRAFKIVKKYDKKVMGWEDIESAKVDSSFIVQHWTNTDKANNGASQQAKVVLSPAPHTYLDMKYNDSTQLGLTWAGAIDINKGYNWIPSTILDVKYNNQILGIESPLWSETVKNIKDIEYMAFPRLIGHSELSWSGGPQMDSIDYKVRLKENLNWLDRYEVNYKK